MVNTKNTLVLASLLIAIFTLSYSPAFSEDATKKVTVDKQVQIVADVANFQDRIQPFAYIVQIHDENNVIVSLAWLTGSLSPNQSLSPALSWLPENSGTYTATIFVWESIDNPSALSPPLKLTIQVDEIQS